MHRWTGIITILLTLAGWTAAPLFIRFFYTHIDAWTSNGWRYAVGAVFWLPLVVVAQVRGTISPKIWKKALVPALVNSMGQVFFTWAHYMIEPGLLTFGLRVQIIFVAVGAALLFPAERSVIRRPAFLVGLGLVMMGTMGTGLLDARFGESSTQIGLLFAMTSGALFAAYALSVRYFMVETPSLHAFGVISQYTAVTQVALMLAFGAGHGSGAFDLSPWLWGMLVFSAIIGIALGHVLYYISIARLGVAVAAGVIQLQPFTVGIASLIVFGEHLSSRQWVFGGIAVGGAILILHAQRGEMLRRVARRAGKRRSARMAPEARSSSEDVTIDA
ncbi:MAG: DMT family transporter [Phycisphaerales bacterium]|nr:DMT family transporter [Phycisphaerales bacterium]